jgi:hypothetical protein
MSLSLMILAASAIVAGLPVVAAEFLAAGELVAMVPHL